MQVYLVTNKIDGKQYVGQTTKTLEARWFDHIQTRKNPSCKYLYSAVQKHGVESFEIETLVIVNSKEEMDRYERGLIKALGTKVPFGYNLTDGGDGAQGFVFTDEQRRKISLGLMGRKMSDKARQKLLERNKENKFFFGHKLSAEHRRLLLEHNTGKKASLETREKMAIAHAGKRHTEETKQRMREAQQRRLERERSQCPSTIVSELPVTLKM
jgi:group I intron endonuclease